MKTVDLSKYKNWYGPRMSLRWMLWFFADALFLQNPFNPFNSLRVFILRLFGARIGRGVIVKPRVHVKFPWQLNVGDYSWIGEQTWIDNHVTVDIGRNVCISQNALLLTGTVLAKGFMYPTKHEQT